MTALADLKLLDISRVLAGPNCTNIFADFGAEVWKIEALQGDEARTWGEAGFATLNRGKNSVAINFADTRGQDLVKELAKKADVAVENFKVGNLARFGIDLPSLMKINNRLVALSATGFGQTGPYKDGLGYDMVLQAMTGLMSVTGFEDRPPVRAGSPVMDIMLGLYAAIAIMVALHERETSGKGQYIDVSLFDVGMGSLFGIGTTYLNKGIVPKRQGAIHPSHAPVEPFMASDGEFLIAVGTDGQFQRLAESVGMPELGTDARFAKNEDRFKNRQQLADILQGVLSTRTRAEWQSTFLEHKVPAGPLYDVPSAFADPQAKARESVWTIEGETGLLQVLASPIQHMSRTPPTATRAPRLGEHTAMILKKHAGLTDDDIAVLEKDKVIGLYHGD
ncbi:CoA transferase [Rhodobacteraceae bacterium LMO-12]|nr:CoA transferase [Rhodobacteraceae bacterium LMO-JJ12]